MQKGYLVIDLLVSCLILIILSSYIFISMSSIKDSLNIQNTAEELVLNIRQLQIGTMNNIEINRQIVFQANPPLYRVIKGADVLKTCELPKNIFFIGEPTNIQFNLRGMPIRGAQTITLYIIGTEQKKTITIVPITGRIAIID